MAYPIDLSNFLGKRRRKLIPVQLFEKYNGKLVSLRKGHILFEEGDIAKNFFQVEAGQIRMYIVSPDGQEFTQGIFSSGESFGEPALLGGFVYPSGAIATEPAKVWRLPKAKFLELLKGNFEIHMKLDQVLCKRLQYKSMMLTEVSSYDPEHRITTVLRYFKNKIMKSGASEKIVIPFTRQQLADMTGLRVETVIRTVKKMENEEKLLLEGHKIKF